MSSSSDCSAADEGGVDVVLFVTWSNGHGLNDECAVVCVGQEEPETREKFVEPGCGLAGSRRTRLQHGAQGSPSRKCCLSGHQRHTSHHQRRGHQVCRADGRLPGHADRLHPVAVDKRSVQRYLTIQVSVADVCTCTSRLFLLTTKDHPTISVTSSLTQSLTLYEDGSGSGGASCRR